MSSIRVKATPGRIAREAPEGHFIPHDAFVAVQHTPYIERLLNHHGDIMQEPAVKAAPAPTPMPAVPPANEETS